MGARGASKPNGPFLFGYNRMVNWSGNFKMKFLFFLGKMFYWREIRSEQSARPRCRASSASNQDCSPFSKALSPPRREAAPGRRAGGGGVDGEEVRSILLLSPLCPTSPSSPPATEVDYYLPDELIVVSPLFSVLSRVSLSERDKRHWRRISISPRRR